MTESHYEQVLRESLRQYRELWCKREEIEADLIKLRQFLYATLPMIPFDSRPKWEKEINIFVESVSVSSKSLAESVRKIYRNKPFYGYTLSGMRQELMEAGFDFSAYTSNPLSSISTTLRRMVETGELDTRETEEGQTIFFPHGEEVCRCDDEDSATPSPKKSKSRRSKIRPLRRGNE